MYFDENDFELLKSTPYHWTDIVNRAKALLKQRNEMEIKAAAYTLKWMINEEISETKKEARKKHGADNDIFMRDFDALQNCINIYTLDAPEFPHGQNYEYVAVLTLWLVAESIKEWQQLKNGSDSTAITLVSTIEAVEALCYAELLYKTKIMSETINEKINEALNTERTNEKKKKSLIASMGGKARNSKPQKGEALSTYEKQKRIKEIWASGKYTSRDRCAEEECGGLNMSFASARKALRNTPTPT